MANITCTMMQEALSHAANAHQAKVLAGFFKTGPGEYGEGDRFRGIKMPKIRLLVREFADVAFDEIPPLLLSSWHEDRMLALLLLVDKYQKGNPSLRRKIYDFYSTQTSRVNNWDLVDLTAEHIMGAFLYERSRKPLYTLASSSLLWNRRIALLSTFYFIRRNDFQDTLNIVALYCSDKEDLIHKASGWMLREIGKRSPEQEERFLQKHIDCLPRTTLRYAIERFPEEKRLAYLHGSVKRAFQ